MSVVLAVLMFIVAALMLAAVIDCVDRTMQMPMSAYCLVGWCIAAACFIIGCGAFCLGIVFLFVGVPQ